MNIKNLRAQTDVELEAVLTRRRRAKAEIELILDEARKDGRPNLTEEEQRRTDELFQTIELSKAQEIGVKDKLKRIMAIEAEEADFESRMNAQPEPSGVPETHRTASVQVGREARTYSRETDPTGRLFFSDVINQFMSNDVRAADRLGRHIREEQIERKNEGWVQRSSSGVGTGAFSGLTVPQYLLDMVAPAIANMRPFADKVNKHPLPANGMSVNISRITTPATAGLQSAELAAVAWQDMDDTLLTIPVQTAAGQQLVSRQAIERGQGIEDVILQDLMKRYNTVVDSTLITQATTGLQNVANSLAYTTGGTPSATEMYPLIVGAVSQSATAVRGVSRPDFALMHPRRWYWLQSQLVNVWPAFGQPGIAPRNIGTNNNQPYDGPAYDGVLPCGVNVIADANVATNLGVGTNQDAVYVGPLDEVHLWEDQGAPVFIRAEQPAVASLGINLVVYGYFAYTMQRYSLAFQGLSGTGTVAPTGF